ncbi:hypothetical protein SARC_14989, partial [Sphaeroforma arctica JP610]
KLAQAEERRNKRIDELSRTKETNPSGDTATAQREAKGRTPPPPSLPALQGNAHTATADGTDTTQPTASNTSTHTTDPSERKTTSTSTSSLKDAATTKSVATKPSTRLEVLGLRRLRDVIARVHKETADAIVPEADLEAWRKHSLATGIKSVSKLLNES